MNGIQIGDSHIDSRDIIKRIDELERDIDDFEEELDEFSEVENPDAGEKHDMTQLHISIDEAAAELALWREFEDAGVSDWDYGAQFIEDSHFEDHARELAEDVIDIPDGWPCNCIDWERAARELQVDYTEVEVDGITYRCRA